MPNASWQSSALKGGLVDCNHKAVVSVVTV